ncbi:hypothetical protein RRF57_004858 [Xylaria bambusicola]|uniref:Uncharacterized protein n=1 Tax=Xylaria bambusicola TaxID=326684 RepID=A0AAN7UH22_9PEZI
MDCTNPSEPGTAYVLSSVEYQREAEDRHAPPPHTSSGGPESINKKSTLSIALASPAASSDGEPDNHRSTMQAPTQPPSSILRSSLRFRENLNISKRPMKIPMSTTGRNEAAAPSLLSLIPNTGRVSRAKKENHVHTCELCHPPKASLKFSPK